MTADKTDITVAHLVVTLDRIDEWLQAIRKGLEALPQGQVIDVEDQQVLEVLRPQRRLC